MPVIFFSTTIKAPIERCFDLPRRATARV